MGRGAQAGRDSNSTIDNGGKVALCGLMVLRRDMLFLLAPERVHPSGG